MLLLEIMREFPQRQSLSAPFVISKFWGSIVCVHEHVCVCVCVCVHGACMLQVISEQSQILSAS